MAAGSSGRARTRRGRGGSRRRTRSRRTCGSRARAHGAASAAGIATDGRRRRRWRVRAGNVAPVAGGELLQAEVQHAGLHTRLSCARRARQHAAAAGACSGDSAGGFERARLAPVAGEPLSSGSPSVSGGRDSNMRGSAAHEGRTAWHQLRASRRTPGGVGGGGSRGSVAPVASGPWEAMRFVPLVHAGRGEGVGGAWVASTASAIFSNSLVRKKFQKVGKLYFSNSRRLRSAQLMTLARRPRKVATTPSTGWASAARPPARRQRAPELSSTACRAPPAGRVVPAAPASAATCRSGRWRADADDDV